MAWISFNDGTARVLTATSPHAISVRFANWLAQPAIVGPARFIPDTGRRHVYVHREDWRISFSMPLLKDTDLEIAQYLIAHLQRDNTTCTVHTADLATRSYTAFLGEGDSVTLRGPEGEFDEYTLDVQLTTTATAPPLCLY